MVAVSVLTIPSASPIRGENVSVPYIEGMDAFPKLINWSSPKSYTVSAFDKSKLTIGFPKTLSMRPNTMAQYAFSERETISAFHAEVLFDYEVNPSLAASDVSYETDEFSIWAGQPEADYFQDCEWGIVARNKNDFVQLFLQLGDFSHLLYFEDIKLLDLDRKYHEITVTYQAVRTNNSSTIVVSGFVDGKLSARINRTQLNYTAPYSFGLIAKSMRITPTDVDLTGQMAITQLRYSS